MKNGEALDPSKAKAREGWKVAISFFFCSFVRFACSFPLLVAFFSADDLILHSSVRTHQRWIGRASQFFFPLGLQFDAIRMLCSSLAFSLFLYAFDRNFRYTRRLIFWIAWMWKLKKKHTHTGKSDEKIGFEWEKKGKKQ